MDTVRVVGIEILAGVSYRCSRHLLDPSAHVGLQESRPEHLADARIRRLIARCHQPVTLFRGTTTLISGCQPLNGFGGHADGLPLTSYRSPWPLPCPSRTGTPEESTTSCGITTSIAVTSVPVGKYTSGSAVTMS